MFLFFSCDAESSRVKEISISNQHAQKTKNTNAPSKAKIFVAVSTMISPMETFNLYEELIGYISEKLNIDIEFKQRKTYSEVNDLLKHNKLDFAFICTGAYINAKKNFPIELLAVPVVDGKPFYNAYVIINRKSSIKTFKELSGKSFAFTDPLSNTGYNYIVSELKTLGTTPEKFFSKTIFTYAHDFSIQAVARDLVDGATVDGLVYEYIKNKHPEKVARISVLNKSRDFGMPPFVVNPNMDPEIKLKLRKIMTTMHLDIRGKEILKNIMIDKFLVGDESIYGQQ